MKTADLQYDLPPELIAQSPADRRDASRLLVVDRSDGTVRHEMFGSLPELLPAGAALVFNDTKVLPARLRLRRRTGGHVQGLFLREPEPCIWHLMLTSGRRLKPGEQLAVEPADKGEQYLRLIDRMGEGTWRAEPVPAGPAEPILARFGAAPLPPYIRRDRDTGAGASGDIQAEEDLDRYQTVFARQPGAVAAPTAGLHFTPALMRSLEAAGFVSTFVTLHVGVGTFAPIRVDDLAAHPMHAEWYECSQATADVVNGARSAGRPVVAVGTTSVRVLESCAGDKGRINPQSGWTDIFIYPPYRFRAVDCLLTNFHLPGSTLLALVYAFAGRQTVLAAYAEAVARRYRFFSYGDAMLIR